MSARWLVLVSSTVLSLLIVPHEARAADPRFYAGVSLLEQGEFSDLSRFGATTDGGQLQIVAGLGLHKNFAVEVGYHDFGETTCCSGVADIGFVLDRDGVSAALVGSYPWRKFSVFAKAGYLWWDEEGTEITFSGNLPRTNDGGDPLFGIGGQYLLTQRLSLRAELTRFEIAGTSENLASGGLVFGF